MNRGFKGIWICKEIWEDKEISIQEKCLLAEIDSLDCSTEHCFASDEYLMEFMGCSRSQLQKMLKNLRDLGYISSVSFDGRRRAMSSNIKMVVKKQNDAVSDMRQLPTQKRDSSSRKNETHREKERENLKKTTTAPPETVVVSSLEKLEISQITKEELSSKHTKEEIDLAVDRTLKWKDRANDLVGIRTTLKNQATWNDSTSKEDLKNENKTYLRQNLLKYDNRQLGPYKVAVGVDYIEFSSASQCLPEIFSTDDKDFIFLVDKFINKLQESGFGVEN